MSIDRCKDKRWKDLGLSDNEIKHVMFLCKKFVNTRDSLDDITQTALIAIYEVFNKYKREEKPINNKNSFIGKVVRCKLVQTYINTTRRDLLYNTCDIGNGTEDYIETKLLFDNSDYNNYIEDLNNYIDSALSDNIDKYIAYGYHILEMNQEDLGNALGVHQTWICFRLKHIHKLLQDAYIAYNKRED